MRIDKGLAACYTLATLTLERFGTTWHLMNTFGLILISLLVIELLVVIREPAPAGRLLRSKA